MAYNKSTHDKQTVLLPRKYSLLVKKDAVEDNRSVSAQIVNIIKKYYEGEILNEMDHKKP